MIDYYPWYKKNSIEPLLNIEKKDCIVFDVETTGFHKQAEILSLSIIDGNENILFDELFKPKKAKTWKGAQRVNQISPEMVEDKKGIDYYLPIIQEIIDNAKLIIGYNIVGFDIEKLTNAGIRFPYEQMIFDVMVEFAPVRGGWQEKQETFRSIKLKRCGRYYGYSFKAHEALSDAKATLFCFNAMLNDKDSAGYLNYVKFNLSDKRWWKDYRHEGNTDRPIYDYKALLGEDNQELVLDELDLDESENYYWEKNSDGIFERHNIVHIIIDDAYDEWCVAKITLDDGRQVRIHNAFLNEMQNPDFPKGRI